MKELEALLQDEWRELLDAPAAGEADASPLKLPASRRMALSRIALFAQLEDVREEWRVLRDTIEPDDVERYVNAGWTLKDLVAHAASWAKEFRQWVETAARGGTFDYTIPVMMGVGPTEWNEEQVRARKAQSIEDSFDELEEETVRLQDLLVDLNDDALYGTAAFPLALAGGSPASWNVPSAAIIAGKCEHDRHHIAQIEKRLASWR